MIRYCIVHSLTGFFLLFCIACGMPPETESVQGGRNGISDSEILIGSSLALGGHAGYLGTQMIQGAMSYLSYINQQGGVHGRHIQLVAMDDEYNPSQCLYNTQQLILEKKVFALFCYVGTPTTVRIIPLINEAGIPLVGMFTGAQRLRQPPNPFLINIRASYYQETEAAVDLIVKQKGMTRVAVFYQYDEYGLDGLRGTEIALQQYDLVPVAKGSYIRGTLDVEAGLAQIIKSDAQAVVMIGTYDSCARFIQLARRQNFTPLFHNVSFVGSKELARRLGPDGEGVIVTQVVPPPSIDPSKEDLPGVNEYNRLLNRYYPDTRPSFVGLEGYINAKILVEGLERAGQNLTRQSFIQAIKSVNDFDLGIKNRLSFGPKDNQGLDQVYFTVIRNENLVLLP